MAVEIEHKFLVRDERWRREVERSVRMRQGYLTSDARCSVRVRVAGDQGHLNVKSGTLGIQRSEYEYLIPLAEAEEMLDTLCEQPLLEKTRHFVRFGGHLWEIDEFEGDNAGLIVADGFGAAILRESPHHPLAGARRKAVTLRFARCAAERLMRLDV